LATGFGLGFLLPNLAAWVIARSLGFDMVASYVWFSKTTVQGDLDEGWRYVAEYFWSAEGINVIAFDAALVAIIWMAVLRRSVTGGVYGALIAMVIYGLLVLGSDVFLRFAVAARHVRAIAPFGAWVVGAALSSTVDLGRWGKGLAATCCALIACVAASNFAGPLAQVFPRGFDAAAQAEILEGRAAGDGLQPLRIVNDTFFHDPSWNIATPTSAGILWSRPHPFAYEPYLFEGYGESERNRFMQRERSMKVLRFDGVKPIPAYPYAFKLTFSPGIGDLTGLTQPILCSGSRGAGDLIFLTYLGVGTAEVGLDHWGHNSSTSAPFPFAPGHEHTLVVIAPCLVGGAASDPVHRRRAEWWAHHVYVSVDGVAVMNISADFYPTDEHAVTVGLNLIGATSSHTSLQVDAVRFAALEDSDWAKAEADR
jgi:hypothetical protein